MMPRHTLTSHTVTDAHFPYRQCACVAARMLMRTSAHALQPMSGCAAAS